MSDADDRPDRPERGISFGGRYRVMHRLGSGGMAMVFLAEDEVLGRQVAVKRMRAESSDQDAERFRREAQLAASLNHPNVVKVYDTLADDDAVVIVMEYVAGNDLDARMKRGAAFKPGEAMEILRGVAAGLDHAHEAGLIHRDVKPSNVLLGSNGDVKLTDLGVAKALQDTALTQSGIVLGTPLYMAPEQLTGEGVTPAADIYALALIAFQMLSGTPAREKGSMPQLAHRAVNMPAPDIREAWPEAPEELAEVLGRALDRDPVARPRTATELVGQLERGLRGEAAEVGGVAAAAGAGVAELPEQREVPTVETTELPVQERERERERERVAPPTAPVSRRPAPAAERVPVRSHSEKRGLGRILALAALLLAVGVAGFLVLSSGDPSESGETGTEQVAQEQTDTDVPEPAGGDDEAADNTTADQTEQDPVATPGDEAAAALQAFYEGAAAGDYEGALALATPGLQATLGGLGGFEGAFDTLESIEFTSLKTTSATSTAATVAFSTVATHTGFTDTCTGTASLVNDGGWLLDNPGVDCVTTEG